MSERESGGMVDRGQEGAKWLRFDPAFILLVIAVAMALVFVGTVAKENALLRAQRAQTDAGLAGPQSAQPGDIVPGFKAVNIAGGESEVVYDGSKRFLIYVFSPACGVCENEPPKWNRIAAEAASHNLTVRGISLDPVEESRKSLAQTDVVFDILVMPSLSIRRAYRVVSIPMVLIVSSDGRVDWVHYGAMTPETTETILGRIRSGS